MSKPQVQRNRRGHVEWTPAMQERLEVLWNAADPDGQPLLTTNEMARDLGITRNALLGRVHRCKLPARESPIALRMGNPRSKRATGRRQGDGRIIGPTLALEIPKRERSTGAQALGPTLPVVAEPVRSVPLGPVRACCWPMWPDGERPRVPRFCEAPSKAAKPYCPVHYAVCYHRVVSHGQTLRERIP